MFLIRYSGDMRGTWTFHLHRVLVVVHVALSDHTEDSSDNDSKNEDTQHQQKFDMRRAQEACQILRGTHDFSAFRAAYYRGSERKQHKREEQQQEATTASIHICTFLELTIFSRHSDSSSPFCGDLTGSTNKYLPRFSQSKRQLFLEAENYAFVVTIQGDLFLYKMFRMIVGVLISVGYDTLSLQDVHWAVVNGHWNTTGSNNNNTERGCVEEGS
jgi:tRNA U38,U39,U40 pseudouridine synthase TruA